MNKAQVIKTAPNTIGNDDIPWIGTYHNGKSYLWWMNTSDTTENICKFLAKLKIVKDTDGAIGEPVDLATSKKDGYVKVLDVPNVVGIYIETDKRPLFNFFMLMGEGKEVLAASGDAVNTEFQRLMNEYNDLAR